MKPVMAILTALVVALWAGEGFGQVEVEWEREYISEQGSAQGPCYSQLQLENEDYILAGGFPCYNGGMPFSFGIVLANKDGAEFDLHQYANGDESRYCRSIIQTSRGYSLFGKSFLSDSQTYDFMMLQINENLDSIWTKYYGGDDWEEGYAQLQTRDGGFALTGWTRSFGAGSYEFWLLRTDENGDSLWSRTYGGRGNELCKAIIELNDGGFLLAGTTSSFGTGLRDYWIVRTNSNGDSLWSSTFGGEYEERFSSIAQCSGGGFILAGTVDAQQGAYWIVRVSDAGDSLWSVSLDGINYDSNPYVIETTDGCFAIAGTTITGEFVLVKYSESGESLWSCQFEGDDQLWCNSLIQTKDGGFSLVGEIWHGQAPFPNFYQVKTTRDPVSVRDPADNLVPSGLNLLSAYPNPFNSTLNIGFSGPINREATLRVTDALGREACLPKYIAPNSQRVVWNAEGLPAGKYVIYLEAGTTRAAKAVTLLR